MGESDSCFIPFLPKLSHFIPFCTEVNLETALPVLYIRRSLLETNNKIEMGKIPEKGRKEE
jgi:hypothetical protein